MESSEEDGKKTHGSSATGVSQVSGELHTLISKTQACVYQALQFFVSWQGVLTIAYSGLPPHLVSLKKAIEDSVQGIIEENPGSKWPKTSVACLHNYERLSMPQLIQLRQICSEESVALLSEPPIVVDKISVVLFQNACLEKTLSVTSTPLVSPLNISSPTSEEKTTVMRVLSEFAEENLSAYYFHASKDGNRSAHYRDPRMGATLVHFLTRVPPALARFRQRVDQALPNMYDWFSEDSLHITLRALF